MLKIDNNSITLTRGDSAELELTITDANGDAYDYSGDTVKFGVKRRATDTTPAMLVKEFEDGKITFNPEDTANMEYGDYLYDVQLEHTTGAGTENEATEVYTVIAAARFTVGWNIL